MKKPKHFIFLLIFTLFSKGVFSQDVGDAAPDFTLETLGGPEFMLSSNTDKVVFIFLFGYACPHCLSNGPNTQSGIYEVYRDSTDFVAIGIDTWDGNSNGVANYKAATGIEYPLCLMGSQLEQEFKTTYDRIIVIDKDGIIRYKSTANATSDIVNQASEVIATYLNIDGPDNDDPMDDIITSISGIENRMESLTIYPSPAMNRINIESSALTLSQFKLKIIDRSGKVHFEQDFEPLDQPALSLDLENLSNGLYVLQIMSNKTISRNRFVVMK